MTNKYKKISIGGFALLSILSIFFLLNTVKKTPPPSNFPNSTPIPIQAPLQIISSFPPAGTVGLAGTTTALTFSFNKPVTLNQVRVDVSPQIKLTLTMDESGKILIARPQAPWPSDKKYKITVTGPGGIQLLEKETTFIDPSKSKDFLQEEPEGGI